MKKIVFATGNEHKLREIRAIMPAGFEIIGLAELGCTDEIAETADTLEGNALLKMRYIANRYGCNCFADDTGLEVNALKGAPGVYSARYAGHNCDPAANIRKLLTQLAAETDRTARFRTVIALGIDGREYLFDGIVGGQIVQAPRGTQGFGYDPVFLPDGYDKTFAELGDEVKNTISHRARAVGQLVDFLATLDS